MKMKGVIATLLFLAACGGSEGPAAAASCKPAVSVTVPAAPAAPAKSKSAAPTPREHEVVQVYWDISKSMRNFAAKRAATRTAEAETDDLTPVVEALDSSVLLRAHANRVEQYGVGESIAALPSARAALQQNANATVLHLAAEQIGSALANGTAHAALIVSDLELDTPPRTATNDTVCGVSLPSTPQAGALFGRCFESATLAAGGSAVTRMHLLAHVFRKSSHGRELFILLLATDRAFGRRISDEMTARLDFTRQVIFDSGAVASSNVRGCTLTALGDGVQMRSAGCSAKCFEPESEIRADCDLARAVEHAWVEPAGRGEAGVTYQTTKSSASEEQAAARFTIPCSTPPGRFQATVAYEWHARTPWTKDRNAAFAQKASVRDLFDSLAEAIGKVVAPRKLRIGIDLAK